MGLKLFLDQHDIKDPPTNTLIRLAELVLTLNVFEFNQEYYHQLRGVSMGSRFGPSYACLFLGHLENTFLQQYSGRKPELLLRYIDDIMGVTTMSKMDLEMFIREFNDFHPAIRVTSNISEDSINFLDICIKNDDTLTTSIHYKDTDSHCYLNYNSYHPDKCKEAIPYSQFLRLKRLCSEEDDFVLKAKEMSVFFQKCGYPEDIIKNCLTKCHAVRRDDALLKSSKENTSKIPLVLMFDPFNKKVSSMIHRNYKMLTSDPDYGTIFKDNLISAFSNHANLKKSVVHSCLPSSEVPGTYSCSKSRCITCQHVVNNTDINGPLGSYSITKSFTCTSTNIIYGIICLKCGILYIGETGRQLKERIREHLRDVKKNTMNKEVAIHFNQSGHSIQDLGVFGIQYFLNQNKRRLEESKLIKKLGTLSPLGLNRADDFNYTE